MKTFLQRQLQRVQGQRPHRLESTWFKDGDMSTAEGRRAADFLVIASMGISLTLGAARAGAQIGTMVAGPKGSVAGAILGTSVGLATTLVALEMSDLSGTDTLDYTPVGL